MNWKYYNHAMLPTTAPHESPDMSPISDGSIWKPENGRRPLFVRWTTDFDCGYETQWWYCIKDTVFELKSVRSKIRYEVNRANKFFAVREIDPVIYVEEIIKIQAAAWGNYPEAYRPKSDPDGVRRQIEKWRRYRVFGAFCVEDDHMAGYALLTEYEAWVDFTVLKADPAYERSGVNVAIVAKICDYYNEKIKNGYYICDGERNVIHETSFQEFLVSKFGFRKAYCKLNIRYKKSIAFLVKVLYPFRKLILKSKKFSFIRKLDAILLMESICREQR